MDGKNTQLSEPRHISAMGETTLDCILDGRLQWDTLDRTMQPLAERFLSCNDADHAYIILTCPQPALDCMLSAHRGQDSADQATFSKALISQAIRTARPILLRHAMDHSEYAMDPQFQQFNIRTAFCAPMVCDSDCFGVVYLDSVQEMDWDEEWTEQMGMTARLIGLRISALAWRQNAREMERLAMAGKASLKLSHSVKNVLQMIGGAAEVVDYGLQTNQIDRVKCSWQILKPNVDRMKRLVLDMLDYSKERRLELEDCDFNRVIQGAVETLQSQLRSQLQKCKVKLSLQTGKKIPTARLDGERIHEMALNLIVNAIDAVQEKGGKVRVSTWFHLEDRTLRLSVSDNGPGISEAMKAKIFTPFESDKNKFGTGLGMAIAKQVIDQHSGTIAIETEAGKGTTFTVALPLPSTL
ncbi:MAG: GAF domain-containing sensor histidine kinase [Sedimentisphaerales bacterium]|nr:GAF domain-containing sensor histidine kinase [Sedimentisphaerales bacterium]